jgi:hypothetical protein
MVTRRGMTASGCDPYAAVGRFVGLDHGVGHLRGLCAKQKSLSTRERTQKGREDYVAYYPPVRCSFRCCAYWFSSAGV